VSKNYLTIGEIFLGTEHSHSFYLENKGQIPGPFTIDASSDNATTMFEPSSGIVDVQGKFPIHLKFTPTKLGAFEENYKVMITGAEHSLNLLVKWECLGPTFKFDADEIQFGKISTGFTSNQQLTIQNTSPIPIHYTLHLDSMHLSSFTIKPDHGIIPALSSRLVKITCTPKELGILSGDLVFSVREVGENLYHIPITAESRVPEV